MAEKISPSIVSYIRYLIKIEAPGIRTALAATVPLILGQVFGFPVIGLFVGLGGIYLSVTDKEGSTFGTLLIALLCNAAAMFVGTILGNDVWLSVISMFAFAFFAGMLSAYGEIVTQIAFIATLVFAVALGQHGDVATAAERFAALCAGGLWSVVLTLLLWQFRAETSGLSEPRDREDEEDFAEVEKPQSLLTVFRENLTFNSIIFRHALRLALGSTIAIGLAKYFEIERGYWLILTVLVIVKPIFRDTRQRALHRVAGSIAGGAIAVILAASIQNLVVLDFLLIVFSILAYSQVRHHYGIFVLFLTPFIVLMIDTVDPGDWQVALTRMIDTVIGGAIALTVAYLLRPKTAFRW